MIRSLALFVLLAVAPLAFSQTFVQPLVESAWLSENLHRDDVVILDVRSGIDNGGDRSSFEKAHIPGAVYSSYTDDGWRESRDGVAGLMPPVANLERLIGGLGIGNDHTVVIVPAGTGPTDFGSAARVYWTFKVMGHESVTILNGGFAGWQASGYEVASGASERRSFRQYDATLKPELIASLDDVQEARKRQAQLVDARPSDYFRGETKSPAARAPGTIPGARSLPHTGFLSSRKNAWFLDVDQITARVNEAELDPEARTIAFCNTGHWAATDWFVMSELAGFSEVAMYDGSMAEWSQDSNRPLQVAKRGLGKLLDLFN